MYEFLYVTFRKKTETSLGRDFFGRNRNVALTGLILSVSLTTVKESFLPLLQSQERTVAEMVDPKMLLVLNNSNKVDWVSQ